MPYVGGKLADWFDPTPAELAAHRMAEIGGKRLVELVALHTPVESGHLKHSWKQQPVTIRKTTGGRTIYATGAETEVTYGPYVEHGTGLWGPKHAKYVIEPKKPGGVLHWVGHGGEDVFATRVLHPGSPGAHMMAIAVGELEAALPVLLEPELHRWARAQERQNRSGL